MVYISKGSEKTAVYSVSDAKALQAALNDNDCIEPIKRQDIVGKAAEAEYTVCFDTYDIRTIEMRDAETITHWLLSLGVNEVLIRKHNPAKETAKAEL